MWVVCLTAGIWAAGARAQDLCALARTAAPSMAACVETAHGAVLAADRGEAERLATLANQGEERFIRWFGRDATRYVIVQGEAAAGEHAALRTAGFAVDLPWFTHDSFQSGIEASLLRQVETQLVGRGGTPEQIRVATDQALAQIRTRMNAGAFDRDPQAVPHELGHGWYVQAYWPGVPVDAQGHYGGPGPDWLDETAAMLMEPESAAEERRSLFRKGYRGEDGLRIDDLATFLHRDHPMNGVNQAARAAAERNGPGVIVMRSQDGSPEFQRGRQAGMFYAHGRAFADFMIERSGRATVFADIGRAFGQGRTIEQWLASNGRHLGLGGTFAELDRQWRTWLTARYGARAAR